MDEQIPVAQQKYAQFLNNQDFEVFTVKGPYEKYEFFLPNHYRPYRYLNHGSFGVVCAALDLSNTKAKNDDQRRVAIKKITLRNSSPIMLKKYLREIKILRLLRHHSIIRLKTILLPPSRQHFTELYLIFQYMDFDLRQAMKLNKLTLVHIQFLTTKMLEGLGYLHSYGILHRDLKPDNLLISKDNHLKIADFGFARMMIDKGDPTLTDQVATRWYRAPQLLMGSQKYNEAVDIWSAGCIVAQMMLGAPVFPGRSHDSQIKKIIELTGLKNTDAEYYGAEASEYIKGKIGIDRQAQLEGNIQKFQEISLQGADLVARMLRLNPNQRITVDQALQHPFINKRHRANVTKSSTNINQLEFEFQFYEAPISWEQYMDMIYEEVLLYHFSTFRDQYFGLIANGISIIRHIVDKNTTQNSGNSGNSMDEQHNL